MLQTKSKTNSKLYRSHFPMKTYTPLQSNPPSMFDTMKQGFSFGVGSSIAHSIFGPKNKDENVIKKEVSDETKLTITDKIYEIYNKCLEKNDNIVCNAMFQNIINK